jgi:dTMP kinase
MFITFEGIDGSGKSTQAGRVAKWLGAAAANEVVLTKEPGGTPECAALRSLVTSGALRHPWSEAYLFMLDRAEHVAGLIKPALDRGACVVCERYHDSTLAYQVWGRGLPKDVFDELFRLSDFPVPDATVFFDLPVQEALSRVSGRGKPDAFEKEGEAFMSRIREGYLALAKLDPKRWIVLNVSGLDEDAVFRRVCDAFEKRGLLRG